MSDRPESLAAALAELQQHLPRIGKDAQAQYGKYADLADVTRALLPVLAERGFSWTCSPTMVGDGFRLEYVLRYAPSNERIEGEYPLPATGSPQQIGSAITYARRYCLLAVTGVAPDEDDDDAQAAEQAAKIHDEAMAKAAELAARAQRNAPPEVRADGSATEAEQMRMNRGHEPGVERLGTVPVDDGWYDEPGQPLDPPAETAWGSISPQQKTRMFAMFTGLGMRQKDAQVAFIEEVTGVRVNSRNDLSYVQAGQVLEALETRSGK